MNKKKLLSLATTGIAIVALTGSTFAATTNSSIPTTPAAHHQKEYHNTFASEELLKLLHVDSQTLHKELKAGKSLADIAKANGVPEQTVVDYFVKKSTERIQKGVQSGKITQEKADKMLAKLPEKMKKLVEHKGGFAGHHHGKHKGQHLKAVADTLGISVDELKTQLKAGKSIADIAQSKGKDKQEIIKTLVDKATQRIDQAVQAGKLPQDQADKIKAKLPDRMQKMVERKGICKPDHEKDGKQKETK